MTRKELLRKICYTDYTDECHKHNCKDCENAITSLLDEYDATIRGEYEKSQWHIVKYHEITDEEREREGYPREWVYYLDCVMPNDGGKILVVTNYNGKYYTELVECCVDDGYYLDSGEDWRDIIAWMPLPEFREGLK